MDMQQIIALGIVSVAALYLGRNALRAWKAFRSGKGCASGCGKCAFAVQVKEARKRNAAPSGRKVIPLLDIKRTSNKRPQ